MRYLLLIMFLILFVFITCSDDNSSGVGEEITQPDIPTGPDTVTFTSVVQFTTGGAVSSKGHKLEYRFDFDADGNHEMSAWNSSPSVSTSWPDSGSQVVKAQARCATHNDNMSPWSDGKPVTVVLDSIGVPDTPTGTTQVYVDIAHMYCTGGVNESGEHPVQYRFDFDAEGGHDISNWILTDCIEHSWPDTGLYVVKTQARRFTNLIGTDSEWSDGLTVHVADIEPPTIHFTTTITRVGPGSSTTVTKPYNPDVLDTVGVHRPFAISYHGTTPNGYITEYWFLPLSSEFTMPGQNIWYTDLTDTLRLFPNIGGESVPNRIFRFAARSKDNLGAVSIIDGDLYTEGVCQIVVNFDPDTEILQALNTYVVNDNTYQRWIDFEDAVPDTVPYKSWITLFYQGWDSPYDSILCADELNKCIRYQVSFKRESARYPNATARSAWLPQYGEDNNLFGIEDSTSMNMGSVEYDVFVRSLDEHGKYDGTPDTLRIIGNYDPVLDNMEIVDHLSNVIMDGDTLTWNWWKPENSDTLAAEGQNVYYKKQFSFALNGTGHDHPDEWDSGIKSWQYNFYDLQGELVRFMYSGVWKHGSALNELSDTMRVTFTYPLSDPMGDEVFNNLPEWINKTYDATLMGRDTETGDIFYQYMFVNSYKELLNVYSVSLLGRWTQEETMRFHLRIVR
jgi:hypothetical protein